MKERWLWQILLSVISLIVLSGCATPPPSNQDNLCEIFRQYPDWYDDALRDAR